MLEPIHWRNQRLFIIDQTLLPTQLEEIELDSVERVWEAIKMLRVRGAPAIGCTAAFGVVVALHGMADRPAETFREAAHTAMDYLATSRPTAVNLFWALDRMRAALDSAARDASAKTLYELLEHEAIAIFEEDSARCKAIGEHGAPLITPGAGVLTHCNAGSLATSKYGTALSVMFEAHARGIPFRAYADETRPLLQGARITSLELMQAGIDTTLICDNTAAQVMKEGKIDLVIVGTDRVAANGDVANKIGTYGVAVLAQAHGIPFYVAAPLSTIDRDTPNGAAIPIEQRDPIEVTCGFGTQTAPDGVQVYSPAFDVTPADLVTGLITEHGILSPPYAESIAACFSAVT